MGTLDDVSGAVGRSAQNPPFAVELDEVAALLAVDQFDEISSCPLSWK